MPRRISRGRRGPLIFNPSDPCAQLRDAVERLRDAYGQPRTRFQIVAWNAVEKAIEDLDEFQKREDKSSP